MNLIITEKPSVARSIASVLGATQKREGHIEGSGYLVSWCAGHLLQLAMPEDYGEQYKERRYENLPIIPETWKHIPSKDKAAQLKILKDLMKRSDVDCIINGCDAGREGELIFRLVYEYAKCKKPLKRLWISSMEEAAIKDGFDKLKDGREYDNLYAAAYCREQADWLVGMNVSRLLSLLYKDNLSAGRVQSPTLAMLVEREAEIASFVKKPFFNPQMNCGSFSALGKKLEDKQQANAIAAACNEQTALVRSVECKKQHTPPPKLYDLTTLQREANRLFGYTAQQTLDTAQKLYERKLLTYPRTDSRFLTSDMAPMVNKLIHQFRSNTDIAEGFHFEPYIDKLINDAKVTDHHAIIPTAEAVNPDLSELSSADRDILRMVTARLLCASAENHSFETVKAVLECEGHSFIARGKTVLRDGWKVIDAVFKGKKEGEDGESIAVLPPLSEGQSFPSVQVTVKEGVSTPPKHYTEDTLLAAMETAGSQDMPDDAERRGLGTPATRASIIEKLVAKGFSERQKKNILPTDKGKTLIAVMPEALRSPQLTAQWEHKLQEVQQGTFNADGFMEDIADFTKTIIRENKSPKPEYTSLFAASSSYTNQSPSLGNCPRCGLPVREGGSKGFFCDNKDCGFKLWKDSKFWTAKKKPLTAAIVKALLRDKRAVLKGLFSAKTGITYDAVVVLDEPGDGYVNFHMEFPK